MELRVHNDRDLNFLNLICVCYFYPDNLVRVLRKNAQRGRLVYLPGRSLIKDLGIRRHSEQNTLSYFYSQPQKSRTVPEDQVLKQKRSKNDFPNGDIQKLKRPRGYSNVEFVSRATQHLNLT